MTLQLLLVIILSLIAIFILLLLVMSYSISYRKGTQHDQNRLKIVLFDVFAEYEKDPAYTIPESKKRIILKTLATKRGFNFVCQNLVLAHNMFQLQTNDAPFAFVSAFEIDRRIAAKLKSKDWYTLAKGIQWSYELDLTAHVTEIKQYVNHDHIVVRREAQLAITWFMGWQSIKFLTHITHPISLWQQIRLMDALHEHPKKLNTKWAERALQSENPDVVALVIRSLIRHNITLLAQPVAKLTGHQSAEVSLLARDFLFQLPKPMQHELQPYIKPLENVAYGNR